jgi:hypothetical protein
MAAGTARTAAAAAAAVMGLAVAVAVAAGAFLSPAAAGDVDNDEGTYAGSRPPCALCPGGAGRSGRSRRKLRPRAQLTLFLVVPALFFSSVAHPRRLCGVVCSECAGGHQGGADRPERSSRRLGRYGRRRPVRLGHGHLQPGPSLRAVCSLSLFIARFCASMMIDSHRNQVRVRARGSLLFFFFFCRSLRHQNLSGTLSPAIRRLRSLQNL